jgi:Na+-transporting methylmalonyl-CoA/oxaloacetate decarboxylase gamma subunit
MTEVPLHRAPSGSHLRLTRRGRLIVLLLLSGLLLAAFSMGRVSSQAAGPERPPRAVVVAPGDTLWSIAAKASPQEDPRVVVDRIAEVNHLDGATLRPGQRLLVPTG